MDYWMVVPPAATVGIAAILLQSGTTKLWEREGFVDVVRGFAILPGKFAPAFAAGLPVLEIAVGAILLSGLAFDWPLVAWSGIAAMCLFAMFAIAIGTNLVRGRTNISCGCFGRSKGKLTWWLVARSAACFAASALTLPHAHRETVFFTSLRDRLIAGLLGVAIVAAFWLSRFILANASVAFESRS